VNASVLQLDVVLLLAVVAVLHPLDVAAATTLPARMSAETETTIAVTAIALAAQKIGQEVLLPCSEWPLTSPGIVK
jgi:hypothetical protein